MNHLAKLARLMLAACLLLALLSAYTLRPAAQSVRPRAQNPATPPETRSQSGPAYGLYLAVVISKPDAHMRVQVKFPAPLNISVEWARPCVPVGSTATPPVGRGVWVMFEQGDTHRPVWMGVSPGI
ncbi:MAG TPA: phage baseplate assembly protein V [Verrucomicrobiae bacterium]|jgi:hypothetical protein|nr:phage baseplate assembly protein V [Verrucomicrobiae bacterium]